MANINDLRVAIVLQPFVQIKRERISESVGPP